ncbi:hypothetical protein BCR35DRAFT_334927 [Leucosporidium creatinivorum]|uniref:Transmembrane protein n=1 Tax=Leucosporidium creatinivorum TaxID=106004 RepID=A0A1Y2DPL8_9BASI|nr:hypothetical protein BCR35DRAFT_334927 [Leucosporidium creatinivorum]
MSSYPDSVTVASILSSTPNSTDPFVALEQLLHDEVYGTPMRKGDSSLYKLYHSSTSHGSYIVPNVIQNWLLYNSIYLVLSLPFVWKACLQQSGSRRNEPLWMCLVYVPLFIGLWQVCWGTSIAALLQGSRLHSHTRLLKLLNPAIVNVIFIAVMLMATGGMAAVAGWGCVRFNHGLDAYEQLTIALDEASSGNFESEGGADTVLAAIPRANELVHEMAFQWYHFEIPFGVCMSFALLAAVIMLVACAFQLRTLHGQINYLKVSMSSEEHSAQALREGSSAGSLEGRARKAGLVKVLRSVIATSLTLCASMGVYASVCVVGRGKSNVTPIFHRYKDGTMHLYVVLFVYGALDILVLALIALQTFRKSSAPLTTSPTPSHQPKATVDSSQPPSALTTTFSSRDDKSPQSYHTLPFSTAAYDPRLSYYSTEKTEMYYEMDSPPTSAYPTHLAPVSDFAPRHSPRSLSDTLTLPSSPSGTRSTVHSPPLSASSPLAASVVSESQSPPPAYPSYPSREVPEVSR